MAIRINYGGGALLDAIAADQSMRSAQRRREESRQDSNDLFRRVMERARLGLEYQDQALRRTQARQGMELDERRLGLQEQGMADTRDRAEAGIQQADRGLDLREKQLLEELQRTKSNDRFNREVQQRQFAQGDRSLDLRETGMYLGAEQAYQRAEQDALEFRERQRANAQSLQSRILDDVARSADDYLPIDATEEDRAAFVQEQYNARLKAIGMPYEGGPYTQREVSMGEASDQGTRIRNNPSLSPDEKFAAIEQLNQRQSLTQEDMRTPEEQQAQFQTQFEASTAATPYGGRVGMKNDGEYYQVYEAPKPVTEARVQQIMPKEDTQGLIQVSDEILKADRKSASDPLASSSQTPTLNNESVINMVGSRPSPVMDEKQVAEVAKDPSKYADTGFTWPTTFGDSLAGNAMLAVGVDSDGHVITVPPYSPKNSELSKVAETAKSNPDMKESDFFKNPHIYAGYFAERAKMNADDGPLADDGPEAVKQYNQALLEKYLKQDKMVSEAAEATRQNDRFRAYQLIQDSAIPFLRQGMKTPDELKAEIRGFFDSGDGSKNNIPKLIRWFDEAIDSASRDISDVPGRERNAGRL